MSDEARYELLGTIAAWDRAMVANDPAEIGRFMSDEWVIVGPDGSVGGKARFLEFVGSGALMLAGFAD